MEARSKGNQCKCIFSFLKCVLPTFTRWSINKPMHTVLCYHNATCLLLWALSKPFRRISLNTSIATWRCGRKPPSGQNIQRWKEKENGLSGYSDGVTRSKTLLLCHLFVPECWRAIFSPQLFEWLRKRCRWCDEGTRNTQYVSSHWPPTLWKEDICTLSCTYLLWHCLIKQSVLPYNSDSI